MGPLHLPSQDRCPHPHQLHITSGRPPGQVRFGAMFTDSLLTVSLVDMRWMSDRLKKAQFPRVKVGDMSPRIHSSVHNYKGHQRAFAQAAPGMLSPLLTYEIARPPAAAYPVGRSPLRSFRH
ncbi:hypothetical protein JEQ12_002952 [Ovis aries]|uniref:Uncharacterized protein n=1 Tax=Ovis aries TaxID=9940 RepID=A0A836CY21_SHEEP|nr:hypothetical protein JEQ12_002952 [Ovis aries]